MTKYSFTDIDFAYIAAYHVPCFEGFGTSYTFSVMVVAGHRRSSTQKLQPCLLLSLSGHSNGERIHRESS